MLDYTTCCKLKAAGYPQTGRPPGFYLWRDFSDPPYLTMTLLNIAGSNHPDTELRPGEVYCPSSDELIAAIQQRWPDYGIAQTTNMSWPLNPPGPARIDGYDAWVIGRDALKWDDSIAEGTGDTPAAALAALYLALAGGE